MSPRFPLLVVSALTVACATSSGPPHAVAPPLPAEPTRSAYERAAQPALPDVPPEELPGLHNVYRLSDDIVSGAEPADEAAFAVLAEMGVRTILSVDGKVPDQDAAARHGLRYVHIPICYSGVSEDEMTAITKTFRELQPPFYVHCYHGKHRGPTAAAIGRIVLDGVSRDVAIAEMRQWCGTAASYEGLYEAIAYDDIPGAEETAAYDFDFPAAHRFKGLRHAMIGLARSWDAIEWQSKHDWQVDPEHPDADAANEAHKIAEALVQVQGLSEVKARPADFQQHLQSAIERSRGLAETLERVQGGDTAAREPAVMLAHQLRASCKDCHGAYRN